MNNDRVQVFNADNGTRAQDFGSNGSIARQFNKPSSVAFVTPPPPVYLAVADTRNHRIQVFDTTTGDFAFKFGQYGRIANGSFYYPYGLDYSPDGERLAVADWYNHRIQVFDADTGDYRFKFGKYGSVANGSFYNPTSVAYSPTGTGSPSPTRSTTASRSSTRPPVTLHSSSGSTAASPTGRSTLRTLQPTPPTASGSP